VVIIHFNSCGDGDGVDGGERVVEWGERPRIKINTKQIACFTVQYLSNALKSREPLYTLQRRHNNNIL